MNPSYFASFRETLNEVAREQIYIDMTEAAPLESVVEFQSRLIAANAPTYVALVEGRVVGWCDVSGNQNPRHAHRASLGMGIIAPWRGHGIGSRLVEACIDHAKKIGLEKIELKVYTSNLRAISLYKRHGFVEEGMIRKYRKLNGEYFDCYCMGLFL